MSAPPHHAPMHTLVDRASKTQRYRLAGSARSVQPRKARRADECELLEQLPNIGPSLAADLRLLGIEHPRELASREAIQLYRLLCSLTGKRQDPCVLDSFMAATDFMRGAEARPWWFYTAERKAVHGTL